MSSGESKELNDLMSSAGNMQCSPTKRVAKKGAYNSTPLEDDEDGDKKEQLKGLERWTTGDGKRFVPASRTVEKLDPGVYEIQTSPNVGIFFEKLPIQTGGLLRFPQTNSGKVVSEIQTFWEKEERFRKYNLVYKRGIILWGPPGSGKSCTIQLIIEDVVSRGGVVLKFTAPQLFVEGIRILREIQPETPVVVLMEDIDSILDCYNESEVLNILDGVDQVDKAVFLATTNYPERLGPRIVNRPSRFDKRYKIPHPNAESRKMYLEHIIGDDDPADLGIDLDRWIEDTEGFSIAHLKELFVAVVILGDDYEDAIETLTTMRESVSSEDDTDKLMGFHNIQAKRPGVSTNGSH
jgi:hypothetical protein